MVVEGKARAYPFSRLRLAQVVEERLGKVDATIWFDRDSRSAAAFDRRVDRRVLTFAPIGRGVFRDDETRSSWNMEGTAVDGPLKGEQLKPLHALMAEWYGWFANYPETSVWKAK